MAHEVKKGKRCEQPRHWLGEEASGVRLNLHLQWDDTDYYCDTSPSGEWVVVHVLDICVLSR